MTYCKFCKPTANLCEKPIITIPDADEQHPCCSRYGYVVTEEGLLFILHGQHQIALLPANRCPMCGRQLNQEVDKCST